MTGEGLQAVAPVGHTVSRETDVIRPSKDMAGELVAMPS